MRARAGARAGVRAGVRVGVRVRVGLALTLTLSGPHLLSPRREEGYVLAEPLVAV